MTLSDLLAGSKTFSLVLFPPGTVANVEKRLEDRNGKPAIQKLFDDANEEWPGVFSPEERIKLTADLLQICIGSLEKRKLFNSNLDAIDDAFEYLVNQAAESEKGRYFPPSRVIGPCRDVRSDQTTSIRRGAFESPAQDGATAKILSCTSVTCG